MLVLSQKTLRNQHILTNPMTQTYDPAAAQANNAARNQEVERAAMPTMKPLTQLADNADHCRQVWECVTERPWSEGVDNDQWANAISLTDGVAKIEIFSTGYVGLFVNDLPECFNPFALVELLTELGYAPAKP